MRPARILPLVVVLIAACGQFAAPTQTKDPLGGDYVVKGGGAALDVFNALADGFRARHPAVRFGFEDIGSAAGMKLAASGGVDLATSSATPAPDIATSLTLVPVGASGTAVIVNAQNTLTGLTKTQVRDVFSGAASDWSQLGAGAGKIIVIVREATSALRGNFDAYFFDGKGSYVKDAIELNTGDDMLRAVSSQSNVIGMITIDSHLRAETRVRALAIDGIAPTRENVVGGRYPVRRPLFLAYNPSLVKPAIKEFLSYVRSDDGQRIIDRITSGE